MSRVTRSSRRVAPLSVSCDPTVPIARRASAKRKQLANANKENGNGQMTTIATVERQMQMVAEALEQTRKTKNSSVKEIATNLSTMQLSRPIQSPMRRLPLQPRDTNQLLSTPNKIETKQIVLSPRTLLLPSSLPETKLTQIDSAPMQEMIDPPMEIALAPEPIGHEKLDAVHALPAPYVTINPDMLRDAAWQFRDLQLLCMRLSLGGRGTRDQLVERLLAWHRKCFHKKEDLQNEEEDDHPLSIRKRMKYASNFSLLQFDTSAINTAAATSAVVTPPPTTPPLSPFNDDHANGPLASVTVATSLPQLLTPLIYRTARKHDGTPRSILSPSVRPKSAKRLAFSVFNGVKLIPSRQVSIEQEQNATPSPTKTLLMEEDESANDVAPVPFESIEAHQPPSTPTAQPKPSFLSSVSNAIFNALSPRKSLSFGSSNTYIVPPIPTYSNSTSSNFTFDRLPSIEARHGDESELDSTMEQTRIEDEDGMQE